MLFMLIAFYHYIFLCIFNCLFWNVFFCIWKHMFTITFIGRIVSQSKEELTNILNLMDIQVCYCLFFSNFWFPFLSRTNFILYSDFINIFLRAHWVKDVNVYKCNLWQFILGWVVLFWYISIFQHFIEKETLFFVNNVQFVFFNFIIFN